MNKVRYVAAIVFAVMIVTVGAAYAFGNYSLVNYPATKGYDPEFLQQPVVKQTCKEAHADLARVGLPDLGYCDRNLGTL